MSWSFWAGYGLKLAIVALVLATLYLIARKLRETQLFAGRAGRCVRVLESTVLSQHAAVYVLRVGARYFLVGAGSAGVSKLAELAAPEQEPRR